MKVAWVCDDVIKGKQEGVMSSMPELNERAYALSLSPVQATVLADACLLFTQVKAGNIEYMTHELLENGGPGVMARRESIAEAHERLRSYKYMATGSTPDDFEPFGGKPAPESAVRAYAVYLALQPEVGGDNPFPALASDGDFPRLLDRDEGLIRLAFTGAQGKAIRNALDFLSRVHIGQLDSMYWLLLWHGRSRERVQELQVLKDIILREVKPLVTDMPPNASWGISSPEVAERARIAFDIQQVVRYRLAWDEEPNGGATVDFYEPMRTSSEEPMPRIEPLYSTTAGD